MISLSNVESKLPPGFRFHPRDEELICDYLMKWVAGDGHPFPILIEVDLNKCEPWDIPRSACVGAKEWYFYSQRDRKYATGIRTNRATVSGYWKATGKDRPVVRRGALVGMRKTLVFYQGRAPKGRKTDWVMHEFRLEGVLGPCPKLEAMTTLKEGWVLCRVFFKNRTDVSGNQEPTTPAASHDAPPSSLPLPSLMDHFSFDQPPDSDPYPEQVPCFSISPAPNFSIFTTPSGGGIFMSESGQYGTSSSAFSTENPSSCNKTVMKAVLNHFTKMETSFDQIGIYGSPPSIGEGSSDGYLSENGMCSMWNQF